MTTIDRLRDMDWQQVVLNGGPPCFHVCDDRRFCGRAQRWEGHPEDHKFIPIDDLFANELSQLTEELSHIDATLARRPALADLKTRIDKIEKAISTAKQVDELTRELNETKAHAVTIRDYNAQLTKERNELDKALSLSRAISKDFHITIEQLQSRLTQIEAQNGVMREALEKTTAFLEAIKDDLRLSFIVGHIDDEVLRLKSLSTQPTHSLSKERDDPRDTGFTWLKTEDLASLRQDKERLAGLIKQVTQHVTVEIAAHGDCQCERGNQCVYCASIAFNKDVDSAMAGERKG